MNSETQILMTKEEALHYFKDIELKFVIYEDSIFAYEGEKDNNIIHVEYDNREKSYRPLKVLQNIDYEYFNISIREDGKVIYFFCE